MGEGEGLYSEMTVKINPKDTVATIKATVAIIAKAITVLFIYLSLIFLFYAFQI